MEKCSIGIATKTDCHLNIFSKTCKLYGMTTLSSEEISLLAFRLSGQYSKFKQGSICQYHKCQYLDYFSRNYKKCSYPIKRHKRPVIDNLYEITLELTQDCLMYQSIKLNPGEKLCKACFHLLNGKVEDGKNAEDIEVRNLILNVNFLNILN